jgi:transposase
MSNDTSSAGRGPEREPAKDKFWRKTLREFATSGQSVRAFCRARQLSEPSFYAWRRTLARRDAATPPDASATPAFLPVRLADAMSAPMEIVLAGGRCIRLRPPVDRAALSEIIAALESAQ